MSNLDSEGRQIPRDQHESLARSNLLERIGRADGELIPLNGQKSRLNEELYVSARYGKTEALGKGVDNVLLVDLFAKRDTGLYPVGHYDWDITGTMAVGDVNRHRDPLLPIQEIAHISAMQFWQHAPAFEVNDQLFVNYVAEDSRNRMKYLIEMGLDTSIEGLKRPIYLKYGLGILLLGLSAHILQQQGVLQSQFVNINRLAGRSWNKYDIETTSPVELSRVTNHPTFTKITEEFVGK